MRNLFRIHFGMCANLLGNIKAQLNFLKMWCKPRHILARGFWFKAANFTRFITHYSLDSLMALLWALFEATARWTTQLHRNLKESTSHLEEKNSSSTTFVHRVLGVDFLDCFLTRVHSSRGHLEHLTLVAYPEVSSLHVSSTTVRQFGISSVTL